jgi:DNA-binding transcriptional ArsR family regulator
LAGQGPTRSIDLGGRGLVLAPSAFTGPHPFGVLDWTGQPALLYPALPAATPWRAEPRRADGLTALLGKTRAAVLAAAASGDTTSRLAGRLEVSLASVSQHLRVLREAGLIRSTRRGQAVHHDLTPLGVQLVLATGRFSQR